MFRGTRVRASTSRQSLTTERTHMYIGLGTLLIIILLILVLT